MLQISFIRQNIEMVKERLSIRYFNDLSIVDKVVDLDEQVRKLKVAAETLQAEINSSSREIGLLMGKGQKEPADQKKQQVARNKTIIQQLQRQDKKRTGLVLKTRPAKNCKENSTHHAWLMLNKEQILRKKIRTTARCDISVKRQLQ